MKSRLVIFLIFFALILGAFEVFVRMNGSHFFALSDKVLLRTAILDRSPDTEVLFIGTSRFLDGIDQSQFAATLKEKTGERIKCFNGAAAGIQGARFAYFAEIAAKKKHLTHVILEVSPPSLQQSKLDFPTKEKVEVLAEDPDAKFATRLENRFQNWVSQKIGIVKYRKALRPKTVLKLFTLYTADFIEPAVWSRKSALVSIFKSVDYKVTKDHAANIRPEVTKADSIKSIPEDFKKNQYFVGLENVSKLFAESDIKVIWVAPPVALNKRSGNHGPEFTSQYEVIAHQYNSTFFDYSGSDIDSELMRDPTHLNEKGRKVFSTILAAQLATHFADKQKP